MRRALKSLVFALGIASPAVVLQPLAQVAGVYFFTPAFTTTMAASTWNHAVTTGRIAMPLRSDAALQDLGHTARTAISSEDGLFYAHRGFDTGAICDALEHNRAGKPLRGASTITQQTARNVFLWQGRSWLRKGLEVGYTVLLEVFVPKDRILELYLNVAETGPMVFGMEAGAQHWYRRPASELTVDEAARLTALLPLPKRRIPNSPLVAKRAQWIRAHLAPMPGEPGMKALHERAREHGAIPGWCP